VPETPGPQEPDGGESGPPQPPQPPVGEPIVVVPLEEFPSRWQNAAVLAWTPHEFTLDFIRIGPSWQFGQVVARISFSPLLLARLHDLFNAHWKIYAEEAGIPPDEGLPPASEGDNGR